MVVVSPAMICFASSPLPAEVPVTFVCLEYILNGVFLGGSSAGNVTDFHPKVRLTSSKAKYRQHTNNRSSARGAVRYL